MSDILQEIKHELEHESFYSVIKKHYKGAIALVVILVFSIFIYVLVEEINIRKQERLSAEYYKLFIGSNKLQKLQENDLGTLSMFQGNIYEKLVKLKYADLLIDNKEYSRAVEFLLSIIDSRRKTLEIKNLAIIKLAEIVMRYKLSSYEYRAMDLLQLATRRDNVPYFYIMRLLLGQLMIETARQADGLKILNELAGRADTPEQIRFFANVISGNYLQ